MRAGEEEELAIADPETSPMTSADLGVVPAPELNGLVAPADTEGKLTTSGGCSGWWRGSSTTAPSGCSFG